MKTKKIIVIVTLILVAIAAYALWVYEQRSSQILLIKESGEVFSRGTDNNNSDFQKLAGDFQYIPQNSIIKTAAGSRAFIIFGGNNLLSLNENSEIQILKLAESWKINQSAGDVWYHLPQDVAVAAATPDLLTDVARANQSAAEPLSFSLNITPQGYSELLVKNGPVVAGNFTGDQGNLQFINKESVAGNEALRVSKELFNKQPLNNNDLQGYWYRRNFMLEKTISGMQNLERDFYNQVIKNINFVLAGLPLETSAGKQGDSNVLGEEFSQEQLLQLAAVRDRFFAKDWKTAQCSNYSQEELAKILASLENQKPQSVKTAGARAAVLNYLDYLQESCRDRNFSADERDTLFRLQNDAQTALSAII